MLPLAERIVKRYLAKKIPDPELRAKLTPDYRLGCKRVLQSNTYYQTFLRDDVTLSTDGVREIVADGVIDANGVKHEADIIIYGTGFHVIDAFDYLDVKGRDGVDLATQFRENGVETYMGMTIHGFPNLYFMLGPNTALGHNSVVFMIEQQTKYIVKMLDEMDRRGAVAAEADQAGPGRVQRGDPAARREGHLDAGRLHQLVPRQPGQEPHDLAEVHVPVLVGDPQGRRRRLRPWEKAAA